MRKLTSLVGHLFLPVFLGPYVKTLKIEVINKPDLTKPAIYIFWHSKMLVGWHLFKDQRFFALVSQSKDGELLGKLLMSWGYRLVRGSSSKDGRDALNALSVKAKERCSIVLTPDGPRGPSKEIKNGPLILSLESSLPIIPVKIEYHKKKILEKSWDNFEIPLPLSKCDVIYGDKFFYTEYLEGSELASFKKRISEQM